jgi:hypothetical protein
MAWLRLRRRGQRRLSIHRRTESAGIDIDTGNIGVRTLGECGPLAASRMSRQA